MLQLVKREDSINKMYKNVSNAKYPESNMKRA